jgi:hypothetical protein
MQLDLVTVLSYGFSLIVGLSSAGVFVLSKVFGFAKTQVIIESRTDRMEKDVEEIKTEAIRLETKLSEQLLRLEDKLDKILLK